MAARIMWVLIAILMVAVTILLFTTVPDSKTPRGSSDRISAAP